MKRVINLTPRDPLGDNLLLAIAVVALVIFAASRAA